ncbi:MAG: hypothetical protein JO028_21280 [Acidobacteriaceae bacterium]|nr:hypothetical protein [Acidobacteriaceae bacterium]
MRTAPIYLTLLPCEKHISPKVALGTPSIGFFNSIGLFCNNLFRAI